MTYVLRHPIDRALNIPIKLTLLEQAKGIQASHDLKVRPPRNSPLFGKGRMDRKVISVNIISAVNSGRSRRQ